MYFMGVIVRVDGKRKAKKFKNVSNRLDCGSDDEMRFGRGRGGEGANE